MKPTSVLILGVACACSAGCDSIPQKTAAKALSPAPSVAPVSGTDLDLANTEKVRVSEAVKNAPTVTACPELEELVRLLPPHLTENFEKAHRQIQEYYGLSPGITALIRIWLACGTSTRIRLEFEHAVLEITKRTLNPHEEDYFDEGAT